MRQCRARRRALPCQEVATGPHALAAYLSGVPSMSRSFLDDRRDRQSPYAAEVRRQNKGTHP